MLVSFLASRYGKEVGTHNGQQFHAFPSTEVLAAEASEEDLREGGFGYRAKFIPATASALTKMACSEGMSVAEMLLSWRSLERKEVSDRLVEFSGIGRKVAGCIALMSLDQHGEIPVDTHVWQIAKRYMPELDGKSLTDRVYDRIGGFFRERFGEDVAGLAHNVLFIAELSDFKNLVPDMGKESEKRKGKTKLKAVSVKTGTRVTKLRNSSKGERGSRNTRGPNGVRKTSKRAARKTEKTGEDEQNA
ncbi:N-glycosylase/DNA lyase OGG1 [Gracilariopsis chorda]|uniref:DNA-(apurinic or apyrimidinic site) lyase n=1 Tax=Gracilariopsis chorda TaxID=448386 RepID=A0A2V3IR08_9FLOR|nr:N-glycosylase/DNA lyase OGG1 [Gracilariopsis chorda]|eukprot:PXF44552.1 N-glycosylase/DNA lyase OGG1 [Gracilariopsis chorda]